MKDRAWSDSRPCSCSVFSSPDAEKENGREDSVQPDHRCSAQSLADLGRDKLISHPLVLELVKTRQFTTSATLYAES
jgi:hypothetical protein